MDPSDTSILTRLGNLFVKEHNQESAVGVYKKVLELDESLDNVWFNMANAQIHIGDYTGERERERSLSLILIVCVCVSVRVL